MSVDASLALRATGLLRAANQAGALHAADVHVASRLGALAGETDERVLLAVALCVRGVRQGSVAFDLAAAPATVTADDVDDDGPAPVALDWPDPAEWAAAVAASRLVDVDADTGRPLRLESGELWLDRWWRLEVAVAEALRTRAAVPPAVDPDRLRTALARLWPGEDPDDQRRAAAVCVLQRVAVLGGGPGTGKTTTVARLLAALAAVSDGPLRVALAAPTGKAAARLTASVRGAATGDPVLAPADRDVLSELRATTLHRLLGLRRGSGRSWYDDGNRLPHDVVVVDEASMLSLALVARLLAALRPGARLVLVGDPDQLASVEAGAVLADLVAPARDGARTPALAGRLAAALPHDPPGPTAADAPSARVRDGVALLVRDRRFDGPIAALARAVRAGDADTALDVLRAGGPVRLSEVADDADLAGPVLAHLRAEAVGTGRRVVEAARAGDGAAALAALEESRLLCAHRRGRRGVADWTRTVERWWREDLHVLPAATGRRDGRYAGQPLLVTANDPGTGLSNGDTGVVVAGPGDALLAAFDPGDGVVVLPLGRLGDVRPLHAMTVHRSQGSQYARVTVLLPPASSPLGTRETLYTAVTRASASVHVVGSAEAVVAAVQRPVARATGLRRRLA